MGENEPMENSEKRKFASPVMADTDILFPSTLGKLQTQTLGGSVIGNFSVRSVLKKWQLFFNFFIMANTDIPFPLTLRKPETKIFLYDQY